jgi:hypothetical protein
MTDELVDPLAVIPRTEAAKREGKRARLLVAEDDGTVFLARELPPDVAAARRRYLASFSNRLSDARDLGAVEDDGGPSNPDGLHYEARPWYDFRRSLRPVGMPHLPPADLDGLPADADRQPAEDEP